MPPWKESIEAMLMILPPGPCLTICARHGLAQEEHGFEVDVHHVVPVLLGELERSVAPDDAGVVDQDVDAAVGLDHLPHDLVHGGDAPEVGLNPQPPAAQVFEPLGPLGEVLVVHCGDVGAGLGQPEGHRFAQADRAAGHDGHLPVQSEVLQNHNHLA